MQKYVKLIFVATFLFTSQIALAETLDVNIIKQIHGQVVTSFMEKCKKDMKGATDAICSCLAEKAQANLDDSALAKCTNDEAGGVCVSKEVTTAVTKALSKDNVKECTQPG